MKFKKLIKDNIKRISAVILCMILIFTCTITAFAFDGEAPSKIITADDLKEYHDKTILYFNSDSTTYGVSPIYSPFNLKTMDAVMSISASSSDGSSTYTLNPDFYFAVSTSNLSVGYLKTYYVIPSVPEIENFWDFIKEFFGNDYNNFAGLFYRIMAYCYSNTSSVSINTVGNLSSINFGKANDYFDGFRLDDKSILSGLVYSVEHTRDGLIRNITYGGYYENIASAFSSMGTLDSISQIYLYDANNQESMYYDSSLTPLLEPTLYTEVINLNQYISSSTYSLTAMDYFAYEEVDGSGSYVTLKSNYYSMGTGASLYVDNYIPSHFLKEEYRSGSKFTQISKDSTNAKYYKNSDIYEEGKSWIFIGQYNGAKVSRCMGGYYLEFADGTNPIVYLKLIKNSVNTSSLYAQLISKVDYTLYYCGYYSNWYSLELGTFDAETTTYTGTSSTMMQAVDYYNNQTSLANTSISKYPSIMVGSASSNGYTLASLSDVVFGTNCVASCYSTETQGVGFYYYISPENMPNIIENSNSSGGSIGPGDIGGEDRPTDSLDWEKFWEFTVDYDNLYPDGFDLNLPEYPEFTFEFNGIEDIFDIPDYMVTYMTGVVDWISESLPIFADSIGGPVQKVYYIVFMALEAIPDVFRFLIIFSVAILLFLKVIQAASATTYMLSSSISSSSGSSNRSYRQPNNYTQHKQNDNSKKDGD